ncbi:MAG: chromosome partition protein MukF [Lachnospiraceae bacterium]|nr:chromosome partition protein MukF [Lachnospiraceae bacterium]
MWVAGYWMERGFKPEEILSLPPGELAVWQAIAELNREQARQDMAEAFLEAFTVVLKSISGK